MSERERIITAERSIIWAADTRPEIFEQTVKKLGEAGMGAVNLKTGEPGLGAVKLGFTLGYSIGLPKAVEKIRELGSPVHPIPVIFDHQKAGNDIPDMGKEFAAVMSNASVDAAILFPFTGEDVEESWIKALQHYNIGVIVGAEMTHPGINDRIKPGAFERMFTQAFELGVSNFVVPGNKPERVAHWRGLMDQELGQGKFDLFAPGFGFQGGAIQDAIDVAGRRFHPIVGRAIHTAEDPASVVRGMHEDLYS